MKIKYVQLDSSAFFTDLDFIAMTLEERGGLFDSDSVSLLQQR